MLVAVYDVIGEVSDGTMIGAQLSLAAHRVKAISQLLVTIVEQRPHIAVICCSQHSHRTTLSPFTARH